MAKWRNHDLQVRQQTAFPQHTQASGATQTLVAGHPQHVPKTFPFNLTEKKIVRGGPSGTPLGRPLSYVCQLAVGHAGEQPPVTNKIQHQKSKPNHETISKIMLFRHRCMDGKKANPNCATRPSTRVIQNPNSNCSRNAARVTLYPSFSRIIYPQHKAPCGTKRSFHKHIQAYIGASQFSGQSR